MPKKKSSELLYPREIEILDLRSTNFSGKMIADKFSISLHTVNTHMSNARKRNKVNNMVALFRIAVEKGYIPLVLAKNILPQN